MKKFDITTTLKRLDELRKYKALSETLLPFIKSSDERQFGLYSKMIHDCIRELECLVEIYDKNPDSSFLTGPHKPFPTSMIRQKQMVEMSIYETLTSKGLSEKAAIECALDPMILVFCKFDQWLGQYSKDDSSTSN